MPMLRADMSVGLRREVMRGHNFDENLLEIVLGIFLPKLSERAFGEELARLDDTDGVAELFDFAHDVGGEDDRLAAIAAFANEGGDGAGSHNVESDRGFVED